MSRFRRVIHNVASGYVVLAATAAYALASIPLALHYLSKERFGLWALMTTIAGYLSLIDLGMSGSVARLLIDHKDRRDNGTYGSLIKTGWLVLVIQGLIIFVVGFTLAPGAAHWLNIPDRLQGEFISLLRWQAGTLALLFALRIFSHLLLAHQRMDMINYTQLVTLTMNLLLLWLFFSKGQGVFSLVWALLIGALAGVVLALAACWRLRLFPPAGAWGRASWRYFREIFDYGKDMFLVAVGTQLIMASQTLVITNRLGLEAATTWNVATRTFNLVCQAIWRVVDVAGPAFSEMIVRGEQALLRDRYRSVVVLTASLSGLAAVVFAMCNSLFVAVWTHDKVSWPSGNDALLGVWMIVLALLHCHNGFVLLTKRIAFMRYVYFIEGLVFVTSAFLTAPHGGLAAVITCSIVCSSLFSGAYGTWRVGRYFDFSLTAVAWRWLGPMVRVLVVFVPLALATWWSAAWLESALSRLVIHATVGGVLGAALLLRYGLSESIQRELLQRAPPRINPILRRVFAGSEL